MMRVKEPGVVSSPFLNFLLLSRVQKFSEEMESRQVFVSKKAYRKLGSKEPKRTFSEEELRALGVRVLVGHSVQRPREHGRSTEKL